MFNQILRKYSSFPKKHIGVDKKSLEEMLKICSVSSLDDLIIDSTFRIRENLHLPKPYNENKTLNNLSKMMNKNKEHKSLIGLGYHNTILPFPIKRHILENPKWYTAYTPYQAEISQGRLESQYNYQVLIKELTGLPIANASLLDEGSAGAEVLNLCNNFYKKKRNVFIINNDIHPQNIEILEYKGKNVRFKFIKIRIW